MNIRKKVLVPVFIVETLLVLLFVFHQTHQQKVQLRTNLNRTSDTFKKLIDSEIKADVAVMTTALDSIVQNVSIQTNLKKKNVQALSADAKAAFERLKTKSLITHFYFHGIDRANLFRMHEPDHFGDKIDRATLVEAERTGRPSFGVEQGPTGASVLRVVYPVVRANQRVGYIELGKEFQDITNKIQQLMGLDIAVLANKEKVKQKSWEKRNNKESFKVDWEFLPGHVVMASSMAKIPEELKQIKLEKTSGAELQEINFLKDNTNIDLMVIPYSDLSGATNTHMVLFYDSTFLRSAATTSARITALVCLAVLATLFLFYFLFLGRVEKFILRQETSIVSSSKLASLGEMAGGIAHEINTPLALIKTLSGQMQEVVTDKILDKPLLADMASQIENTVDRIGKIVSGLRSFARDGSADPFASVQVKPLIDDVISLCGEKLKENSVMLRIKNVPAHLVFEGRVTEISQVLLNLLNNAYDAVENQKEKWIEIEARDRGEWIEIGVKDSGHGISEEVKKKIFQPFFTTKEVGKGTGLGLSIALGMVKSHGGTLDLDSQGTNTCFVIKLPKRVSENISTDKPAA